MSTDVSAGIWMLVLPEVVAFSIIPFILYWIVRTRAIITGLKVLLGLLIVIFTMFVLAFYALLWFGSGMSGGGVGSPLGSRVLQSPLQVAQALVIFPVLAAGLALARKGTLGLWVFATCAGYISYLAGLLLGLDSASYGPYLTVTAVVGLCIASVGFILSSRVRAAQLPGKILVWLGIGATCVAFGMAASWVSPSQEPTMSGYGSAIDMSAVPTVLIFTSLFWLALSAAAAFVTGYFRPSAATPASYDDAKLAFPYSREQSVQRFEQDDHED